MPHATHDEYLMATIQAKGPHFETDSGTAFNILRKAVQASESAMTYVKPFEKKTKADSKANGRGAMLALIDWCGGAATRKARSKAARAVLLNAVWNGQPRRYFHFEDFNVQMKAAFDELALLDEHMAKHVQVETYLDAIVDPKLSIAKATVVAHATLQDSFRNPPTTWRSCTFALLGLGNQGLMSLLKPVLADVEDAEDAEAAADVVADLVADEAVMGLTKPVSASATTRPKNGRASARTK
jgi:hypothetical protein